MRAIKYVYFYLLLKVQMLYFCIYFIVRYV